MRCIQRRTRGNDAIQRRSTLGVGVLLSWLRGYELTEAFMSGRCIKADTHAHPHTHTHTHRYTYTYIYTCIYILYIYICIYTAAENYSSPVELGSLLPCWPCWPPAGERCSRFLSFGPHIRTIQARVPMLRVRRRYIPATPCLESCTLVYLTVLQTEGASRHSAKDGTT